MRWGSGTTIVLLVAVGLAAGLVLVVASRGDEDVSVDEEEGVETPEDSAAVLVGRGVPPAPEAPDEFADVTDLTALVQACGVDNAAQRRLVALGRKDPAVIAALVAWLRTERDGERRPPAPPGRMFSGAYLPGLWELYDTLHRLAPASVPVLADALGDEDYEFRRRVAQCLGRMGEDAAGAVPALMERLAPGLEDVAGQVLVLEVLGQIGESARAALPLFHEYLKDDRLPDDARAAAATSFLALSGPTPEALETCAVALGDQSYEVCTRLVPAIGALGADASPLVPDLLTIVQDPTAHGRVRGDAIHALGNIGTGGKSTASVLIDVVLDDGEEAWTRRAAAWAVGKLGPEAVDALFKALAAADVPTKVLGVNALVSLKGEEGIDAARLLAVLEPLRKAPDAADRRAAVAAASRILEAGDVLVPWIIRWFDDDDHMVRGVAHRALYRLHDATGVVAGKLIAQLGDEERGIRLAGLRGLAERAWGGFGDASIVHGPEATRAVLALLADGDWEERSAALGTLEAMAEGKGAPDAAVVKAVLALLEDESLNLRGQAAAWILQHAPGKRMQTLPYWIERAKEGRWVGEAWHVLKEAGPRAKEALPGLLKFHEKITYAPTKKRLGEVIDAIRGK